MLNQFQMKRIFPVSNIHFQVGGIFECFGHRGRSSVIRIRGVICYRLMVCQLSFRLVFVWHLTELKVHPRNPRRTWGFWHLDVSTHGPPLFLMSTEIMKTSSLFWTIHETQGPKAWSGSGNISDFLWSGYFSCSLPCRDSSKASLTSSFTGD